MNVVIIKAQRADLEEILALQKLCYITEAERYNDFTIPPLVQTLDELLEEYAGSIILKCVYGNRIIGSVKGTMDGHTCHLGRLMVHPDYRGRGYARALMTELETIAFTANRIRRIELFTGEQSTKNIRLYESLGYNRIRTEPSESGIRLVYMEKTRGD
ncbi:MAG: GNAT family N-acetyltransferase [Spirochaetota bacterium]